MRHKDYLALINFAYTLFSGLAQIQIISGSNIIGSRRAKASKVQIMFPSRQRV